MAGIIGRVTGGWDGRNHWERGLSLIPDTDRPRLILAGVGSSTVDIRYKKKTKGGGENP